MAVFGFPKLKIELDDNVGGSLVDISPYVTTFGGWSVESILEELTAAGDADDRWGVVGQTLKSEVTLTGPYDDTANGLVIITKESADLGQLRTLQLTFDIGTAADVIVCECLIMRVSRNPARGILHAYEVVLRPTGAIT